MSIYFGRFDGESVFLSTIAGFFIIFKAAHQVVLVAETISSSRKSPSENLSQLFCMDGGFSVSYFDGKALSITVYTEVHAYENFRQMSLTKFTVV